MAYQPTHPHPYLESVDASSDLLGAFSVVINPKDVITKYEFYLYKIEKSEDGGSTSSTQIHSVNKELGEPDWLYGSELGTSLTVDISQEITGFENGGEYQWKVMLTDVNGTSVESPLYYFTTKATPIITLDVPETIATCEYSFRATYEQEQHEKYMYYQYNLYQNGMLIDSTSEKMDSLLSYKYSGFISGNEYKIELIIVTPDRNTYKMLRMFKVEYNLQPFPLVSNVSQVSDKNCVAVDYSHNLFIKGNLNTFGLEGNILSKPMFGNQVKDIEDSISRFGYICPTGQEIVFGNTCSIGLNKGQAYTLSFYAWCDNTYSICWDLWVSPENGDEELLPQYWFTVTNKPQLYKWTFTVNEDYLPNAALRFLNVTSDGTINNVESPIYVTDIQIVCNDVSYGKYINAESSENITCAKISEGVSIYYHKINEVKPLNFGDDFTIYYSVHFSELFVGDIISLEDEISGDKYIVKYDGKKFYYKIGYNPWIAIDPYVDSNNIHKETSVVNAEGSTLNDIDTNALYMLYADDVVNDNDTILYNDITANFWWIFVLLPDRVMVYKSQKYDESVVS